MKIIIRKAIEADLHAIYNLVVELAIYEKEPESVLITIEDYRRLFNDGLFEALVAEADDTIIGTAIFNLAFSTWKGKMLFLEDFVVTQKFRKTGIGQQLFDQVVATAKAKNCTRMRWMVLDWNEPAINFYKKNNADLHTDWWIGDMTV